MNNIVFAYSIKSTMLLLKSLTNPVPVAAILVAARRCDASATDGHRSLQGAAACLATGSAFAACCPASTATDGSDGICTLLYCLRLETGAMSMRESCNCGQLETACGQVSLFSFAVPNLGGACGAVDGCCGTDTGVGAWNACMATKIDGGLDLPDWDNLIPGGVPDLDAAVTAAASTRKPTRKPTRKILV